jgi:hypothetical protein
MLVSFTQTYGTGRDELFDIHFRDKKLIELKNLFDKNIYSFHNCEKSTIDKFKDLNKNDTIKNVIILIFDDENYTQTVRKWAQYIKDLGCTHFFFSQDDTFSAMGNKNIDWIEFIDYVKEHNKDFLISLYNDKEKLDIKGPYDYRKTFNILKSTTKDFYESSKTPWPMDDTPYMCTIDLIDELYDEEYFNKNNIWDAEIHLREKYGEKHIDRYITDKKLFQNYNLYGRWTFMSVVYRKILHANGLL